MAVTTLLTSTTIFIAFSMKLSIAVLFQFSVSSPGRSATSTLARNPPTSGRSTGSKVSRTVLYMLTISSRSPVWRRNTSARLWMLSAIAGTCGLSRRRYLTSQSMYTSSASKLT